jgi:phosphoribosylformylglycinamidine synthase
MPEVRALVLAGDGINCEIETADACREAGFTAEVVHVNDLLARRAPFEGVRLFVIPGGFSFGDELGSGKILALKLKHGLSSRLAEYVEGGGAMLGICNGFQVLTRLGVFGPGIALAQNAGGHFINQWVGLEISGRSIFTDGVKLGGAPRLELPMRHGEGRLVFRDESAARGMLANGEVVLRYESDVNGSWERVAGLASHGGRVMGLMPHPEAYWCEELHPWGTARGVPLGTEMFKSAYNALKEKR